MDHKQEMERYIDRTKVKLTRSYCLYLSDVTTIYELFDHNP